MAGTAGWSAPASCSPPATGVSPAGPARPDAGVPADKSVYDSVSFADARHGWIVANHYQLLATSDGGTTWQVIMSLPLQTDRSAHRRSRFRAES